MRSKHQSIAMFMSLFLIFAITQFYLQVGLAAPSSSAKTAKSGAAQDTQTAATLTTSGNKPIMVNGNSAGTDTTILPGSTLETPDGVRATVRLGQIGSLDLASNTVAKIDFSSGSVRVTLIKGCLTLRTNKNNTGTVETSQGTVLGKTDSSKDGVIDVCDTERAAAGAAPAGAGTAGGGGGLFGVGTLGTIGIFGLAGAIVAAVIVNAGRGEVTSPSSPSL